MGQSMSRGPWNFILISIASTCRAVFTEKHCFSPLLCPLSPRSYLLLSLGVNGAPTLCQQGGGGPLGLAPRFRTPITISTPRWSWRFAKWGGGHRRRICWRARLNLGQVYAPRALCKGTLVRCEVMLHLRRGVACTCLGFSVAA